MLPAPIKSKIISFLEVYIGKDVHIHNVHPVGGGCINQSVRVDSSSGTFFLKWNSASSFPGMFEVEAKGLRLLKDAGEIHIPQVISTGLEDGQSFLLLEFMETGRRLNNFWEDFGRSLARLHKHTSENFGLDHNNYIGSLPQSNRQHKTWSDFIILERLEPQIRMAVDSGAMSSRIAKQFRGLFSKLSSLFPEESPALLHGDLWNGNYLIAPEGKVCLIDPAVYYGHREMDLSMTRLFGGFDEEFYQAYYAEYPLQKGFEKRTEICNLYPLLVHVNLFGGGYLQTVEQILNKY